MSVGWPARTKMTMCEEPHPRIGRRARRVLGVLAISLGGAGCIGGHFTPTEPEIDLNQPTRAVIDGITRQRQARNLNAPNLVPELRPAAARAALAVARGDETLKTAAHRAALQAVADVGRHVWTFATECPDLKQFRPPPLALESRTLLMGAAAVPGHGERTFVVLVIAEPGTSSLRADQMGGGPGGTNPSPETYAHPSTATGPCGERWPVAQKTPL